MKQPEYITVLDLYAYAKEHKLLEARIRICDGMAVSYYPDPRAVCKGRYEIIIDVSANEPIGYDELDEYATRVSDPTPGMDELDAQAAAQYTADRAEQNRRYHRDVEADRRREYLRRRQFKINAQCSTSNELPWSIYGYGPYHRRK